MVGRGGALLVVLAAALAVPCRPAARGVFLAAILLVDLAPVARRAAPTTAPDHYRPPPTAAWIPSGPAGEVVLEEKGTTRLRLRARTAESARLVVRDAWSPGWSARVGGRDVPVEPAHGLLRGVAVPAGESAVEMEYRPPLWRAAWILCLAGGLLLTAYARAARRSEGGAG